MPGEQEGKAAESSFTQGSVDQSLRQLRAVIEAYVDDFDPKHYRDAYRKIAFSGTTGAFDALGEQQKGDSAHDDDPVDPFRFAADAWFYSAVEMCKGVRDLTNRYLQDLSNYAGRYPTQAAASGGGPEPAKPTAQTAKSTTKK